MREIHCQTGKITALLPEDAWGNFSGVNITPCEGCQHNFHLKQTAFIEGEVESAKLISLEAAPVLTHSVSVISNFLTGQKRETVMCTCNCQVTFPNYRRPSSLSNPK